MPSTLNAEVCKFDRACRYATDCIPTEARHSLEGGLEADLLQAKVAVPEQATPKEHPVQTRTVVHDDHAALPRNEAIACYYHLHAKHQLEQGLERGQVWGIGGG